MKKFAVVLALTMSFMAVLCFLSGCTNKGNIDEENKEVPYHWEYYGFAADDFLRKEGNRIVGLYPNPNYESYDPATDCDNEIFSYAFYGKYIYYNDPTLPKNRVTFINNKPQLEEALGRKIKFEVDFEKRMVAVLIYYISDVLGLYMSDITFEDGVLTFIIRCELKGTLTVTNVSSILIALDRVDVTDAKIKFIR